MSSKTRIGLIVAVGLLTMAPIGYAIGNSTLDSQDNPRTTVTPEQLGANSPDGTEWIPGPSGIYASIPKQSPPKSIIDRCEELAAQDPGNTCSVMLEVDRLRREGMIPPGDYTKEELSRYVDIPLP